MRQKVGAEAPFRLVVSLFLSGEGVDLADILDEVDEIVDVPDSGDSHECGECKGDEDRTCLVQGHADSLVDETGEQDASDDGDDDGCDVSAEVGPGVLEFLRDESGTELVLVLAVELDESMLEHEQSGDDQGHKEDRRNELPACVEDCISCHRYHIPY